MKIFVAVTSKLEDITANALSLPAWDRIVLFGNGLLKVTDEVLNDAARELDVSDKIKEFRTTFHHILAASNKIRGHMDDLTDQGLTYDDISNELGIIFNDIQEWLPSAGPGPRSRGTTEDD